MNELQVQTIVKEPAKVEFNFDELSKVLDDQLIKYEGLEFTEKQVKECKKTITELNKGKKALNDYRLATKKELSKEINDFEARCKHLSNKFDDVIEPLKKQADAFEENRKEEKRKKVQEIVDELIEREGLNEKYAAELVIENSYLNKSTTMKSITEELTTKAGHLGIQQDKEESDKQIIKMSVEMANERHNVNLLDSTYIRLLDYKDVEEIKKSITEDAEREMKRKDKLKVTPGGISNPKQKKVESFIETYEVTGTEEQLDALEEYMSSQGLAWSVIDK